MNKLIAIALLCFASFAFAPQVTFAGGGGSHSSSSANLAPETVNLVLKKAALQLGIPLGTLLEAYNKCECLILDLGGGYYRVSYGGHSLMVLLEQG